MSSEEITSKLQTRLTQLKQAQQKDLKQLQQIEQALPEIKQNITVRSGRIAELEEILQPDDDSQPNQS